MGKPTIFNKLKDLIHHYESLQEDLLNKVFKTINLEERINNDGNEELELELSEIQEAVDEKLKQINTVYNQLFKNFKEIIELTFFVYTVLPKVTYSIKVSHILFRIIDFIKNQEKTKQNYISKTNKTNGLELEFIAFDFDKKHIIYKSIFDNISIIFKRKNASLYAEVETLYLLQITNELGKHYKINEGLLIKHFNIFDNENNLNLSINYFTIISMLSYIKREDSYDLLRNKLKEIILNCFKNYENNNTENTLLLIDVLTCPYLGKEDEEIIDFRRKVLDEINFFDQGVSKIDKNNIINEMYNYNSSWFFKWINNDLGIELNTKRGHSVY